MAVRMEEGKAEIRPSQVSKKEQGARRLTNPRNPFLSAAHLSAKQDGIEFTLFMHSPEETLGGSARAAAKQRHNVRSF